MKKKRKTKVLKKEKRTIRFLCPVRGWVEEEVLCVVYEPVKPPEDTSLADEILKETPDELE